MKSVVTYNIEFGLPCDFPAGEIIDWYDDRSIDVLVEGVPEIKKVYFIMIDHAFGHRIIPDGFFFVMTKDRKSLFMKYKKEGTPKLV